jgi:hypothetical protein
MCLFKNPRLQGMLVFLLILGSPFILTPEARSTEKKSKIHDIDVLPEHTQESKSNIENNVSYFQSESKDPPLYNIVANPAVPENASSGSNDLLSDQAKDSSMALGKLDASDKNTDTASPPLQTEQDAEDGQLSASSSTPNMESSAIGEPSAQLDNESSITSDKAGSNTEIALKNISLDRAQSEWSLTSQPQSLSEQLPPPDFNSSGGSVLLDAKNNFSTTSYIPLQLSSNTPSLSSKPQQEVKKSPPVSELGRILETGDRQLSEQQYNEAAKTFDQALQKAEESDNLLGVAKALSGKAGIELGLEQYDKAEDLSAQALVAGFPHQN